MSPGPEKQFDVDVALEAAMRLFWSRGYEGTSMSALMNTMGISKKSLYDTYGNKRTLFFRALQRYGQIKITKLRAQLEKPGSPLQNIRDLLKGWSSLPNGAPRYGCMLGTNIADFDVEDEEVAEVFRMMLGHLEKTYLAAIERAKAAGELSEHVVPRDAARMMVTLMQGNALISRVARSASIPRSTVNSFLTLIAKS